MLQLRCCVLWCGLVITVGLSACSTRPQAPVKILSDYDETPVPTVASATPTPEETPAPLPTRPVGRDIKGRKGAAIGPIITHLGAARADGMPVDPISVDKNGVPTYLSSVGSGFIFVVEAKPGEGGHEVGRSIFTYDANDPSLRPDLEILSSRSLGDGSPEVCDRMKPKIGGVPGVNPPVFTDQPSQGAIINDMSCRFEVFNESQSSCTLNKQEDYSFVSPETSVQFCMIVARAWAFPEGETLVSVRVRDIKGNPGPVRQIRIRRPPEGAAPAAGKSKTTAKPAKP